MNFKLNVSILLSVLFLLVQCSTIDVAVTGNKQVLKNVKKIAVINFEMSNRDSREQEYADILGHQFLKSTHFNVIERDKLVISKVIGEQTLSRSGIIDESTAAQMGKMLLIKSCDPDAASFVVSP